jgi:phosphoglycolate phosphatase
VPDDRVPTPKPFKCVMFDLDGTLLDTLADLASAMNGALASLSYPQHRTDAYRNFVGDGVDILAQRALPPHARDQATVEQCVAGMRRIYADDWAVQTRPYDGIAELLDGLSAAGVITAVLSNKPHDMTVKVVDALLAQWSFQRVDGAKPGIARKPDPGSALASCLALGVSPAEVAYVGDTDTDMRTAVSAGMYPVGALWGFRDEEELVAAGAIATIAHPAQLLPLVLGA